jgi:AmmeMemoRadiSam system protein A
MGHMSLTDQQKTSLLKLAREAIQHGVNTGMHLPVVLANYPAELAEQRASFVTLNLNRQLRGCMGVLEAIRPLALDVAENAFSAAFRDPRFSPVIAHELDDLDIHISILSSAVPLICHTEPELLKLLRSDVDGLILEEGLHRATFLPSVWETLPSPAQFLHHLKLKAGLPADYWSNTIKFYHYTADYIP